VGLTLDARYLMSKSDKVIKDILQKLQEHITELREEALAYFTIDDYLAPGDPSGRQ
jgi:hypothetical protein